MAVLKSPKNVRNKKIWTNAYCTKFRKQVPFPQPSSQKTPLFKTETVLTRVDELYEKRRLDMRVFNYYGSFYTKRDYRALWWERKSREEWSPQFYRRWRYHHNTYNFVKQDWSLYRIGSIYQQLFNRLKLFLPSYTHNLIRWFTNTFLFDSLVWVTARLLQLVDYSTTTFKARFVSFWQYPTDDRTPKKYVRWFFGNVLRYKHVRVKTRNSLTTKVRNKQPSTLILKLSRSRVK